MTQEGTFKMYAVDLRSSAEAAEPEPPASVVKILEGALQILGGRGVQSLSMRNISEASGVSRATLYRHFATKEKVLAAVAEFICSNFEKGVREAAKNQADPIERFRAVMHFLSRYTRERAPEPLLELKPSFYFAFFRSHFTRHKAALCEALDPTFDYLDTVLVGPVNRNSVAESLVRVQLSTLFLPVDTDWVEWWDTTSDRLLQLIENIRGRSPRGNVDADGCVPAAQVKDFGTTPRDGSRDSSALG